MGIVANKMKVKLQADVAIDAEIDLCNSGDVYFLRARLNVSLPGLEREVAQAIVDATHGETCAYSNATRGNIDVTLNALAVTRQHLGSLDEVTRIVRLGVLVATSGDVREQPKIADGASELLQDVFGKDKNPSRLVYGVASLPLGVPVELELIFEVSA